MARKVPKAVREGIQATLATLADMARNGGKETFTREEFIRIMERAAEVINE